MPRPMRRLRRRVSDLQRHLYPLAGRLGAWWGHALGRRITWTESGPLVELIESGQPVVICSWHQDIVPSMAYVVNLLVWRRAHPVTLMVGDGRAGSLGGVAARGAGLGIVSGGKREEGGRIGVAQRLAATCAQTRSSAVATGDGSRGPAFHARWGAVCMARDTGFPLVPLRTVCSHGFHLKGTWAGFHLPPLIPRGHAHAASGEPLIVPPDADKAALDECRQELERRLNALIPVADENLRLHMPRALR